MKKMLLLFAFLFLGITFIIAQTATYIGTIGKYKIIMELNTDDGENYTGRYHYNEKQQWINLKGKTEGLTLHLKEFVGDKNTGIIELVFEDLSATGSWRKSAKSNPLPINITFIENGAETNAAEPIPDNLTGHYEMHRKVDNTHFPEDYKNDLPLGELTITQLSDREISFELQYTSGYPDYHQTVITERATSLDGGKTYELNNHIKGYSNEEKCRIVFKTKGKDIYLKGGTGPECGSGANANPEGLYKKTE